MSGEFLREIENNYGRLVQVDSEPVDDAILKKKIKVAVDKLTNNPQTRGILSPQSSTNAISTSHIESSKTLSGGLTPGVLGINPVTTPAEVFIWKGHVREVDGPQKSPPSLGVLADVTTSISNDVVSSLHSPQPRRSVKLRTAALPDERSRSRSKTPQRAVNGTVISTRVAGPSTPNVTKDRSRENRKAVNEKSNNQQKSSESSSIEKIDLAKEKRKHMLALYTIQEDNTFKADKIEDSKQCGTPRKPTIASEAKVRDKSKSANKTPPFKTGLIVPVTGNKQKSEMKIDDTPKLSSSKEGSRIQSAISGNHPQQRTTEPKSSNNRGDKNREIAPLLRPMVGPQTITNTPLKPSKVNDANTIEKTPVTKKRESLSRQKSVVDRPSSPFQKPTTMNGSVERFIKPSSSVEKQKRLVFRVSNKEDKATEDLPAVNQANPQIAHKNRSVRTGSREFRNTVSGFPGLPIHGQSRATLPASESRDPSKGASKFIHPSSSSGYRKSFRPTGPIASPTAEGNEISVGDAVKNDITVSVFLGKEPPILNKRPHAKTSQGYRSHTRPPREGRATLIEQLEQKLSQVDMSRKFSFEHLLVNLLYGVFSKYKPSSTPSSQTVRFKVSEGNNGRMIENFLSKKDYTAAEAINLKSNVQWSQTYHKNLVANSIRFPARIVYKDLSIRDEFSGIDLTNFDLLSTQLSDLKLFRADNVNLIKEALSCNHKLNHVSYLFPETFNLVNHIRGTTVIGHKTRLAELLIKYAKNRKIDPCLLIPKTFLLRLPTFDQDLQKLLLSKKQDDNFAEPVIVKPGENSNRGIGIQMAYTADEVAHNSLALLRGRKGTTTVIVQYYISRPLLYQGRKFDIRCYGLIVRITGKLLFFWYLDGYARTSSFQYNVANRNNLMVHLTNEAVQVKGRLTFIHRSR